MRLTHSLRTRYLLLIAVMGTLLVGGILWGQHDITRTSSENADRMQARNEVLQLNRSLQASVFESYKSLNAFLLDPTRSGQMDKVYGHLDQAIADSQSLHLLPWIREFGQQDDVSELEAVLQQLRSNLDDLIATRLDSTRQYPALATANRQMMPNRGRFNNAMDIALRETSQSTGNGAAMPALHTLLEARHLWTQMVSSFRSYLANRVGSFNESSLPIQENAISTMHGLTLERLAELQQMDQDGALGFETSAAVEEMADSLAQWHMGFLRVKAIHQSDLWRADVTVIKERIEPRLTRITTLLAHIEQTIIDEAGRDLARLEDDIRTQTRLSAFFGFLGLVFVLVIVLSLDYLVFRPIKLVAAGLKAEAFGKEGTPLPSASTMETRDLIDAFAEMRSQVHQRQNDLQYQASHDSLTGLPNRSLLQSHIEQAIRSARREHAPFAVLIMDLDRFKEVNDTLGHPIGDVLLREIGQRLLHTLREVDSVARLGGDEFAILLEDSDGTAASGVARKVLDALTTPFEINELRLYIGASIGIAVYPEHGTDVATLIQRADVAMYVAKHGQLGHALYEPAQDEYSVGRLTLMADLRHAIEQNGLDIHYQPKLEMRNGTVVGMEALLRWEHPEYGAIPPEQIVALAEHTGLIGQLTYWVLDRAAGTASRWHQQGLPLQMSVNLSVHNLRDPDFTSRIANCLENNSLPPSDLTLEITEHAMMSNPTEATKTLMELDDMGVMISVDDYGTGFSSLAYLKQLPVDELKIDKSFVMRMHQNSNDEVIVRSTIDLAHNLGLRVVAEGVENAEIWALLARLGCDTAQGYFMSLPLPLPQLEDWLENQQATT